MTKLLTLVSLCAFASTALGSALPTVPEAIQAVINMVESSSDATELLSPSSEVNVTDAWTNEVVSVHNSYRAQYRAPAVTWSNDLYPGTLAWARQCEFHHSSGQGKYGENLFAGTGNPGPGLAQGVKSWMDEASKYDWNHPGFSSGTGHFTQVVWKNSKQVACALADCRGGTIFPQASKYLVCRYAPAGNVQGQYPQNVGRHV
ncbi:hypothetical protein GALMADRAFT_156544 [Galerina marginata CBS 339.88]|uniref:SCP domain-containing protein n=1 Tax=Galerina marginata (strain CBS 339.88) TaxID=685588 RepID=A0A067T6K3_GALM3|nr:hypothetical protein GALMADRAFT_156544 [Galerina marginata CBS 339.88]